MAVTELTGSPAQDPELGWWCGHMPVARKEQQSGSLQGQVGRSETSRYLGRKQERENAFHIRTQRGLGAVTVLGQIVAIWVCGLVHTGMWCHEILSPEDAAGSVWACPP